MPPHPAQRLLIDLPFFTNDDWVQQMARSGPFPPPLLAAAALVPGLPGVPDAAAALLQAAQALQIEPQTARHGGPEPWAEPPANQLQRVLQALLAGPAGVAGVPSPAGQDPVALLADVAAQQQGFSPGTAAHIGLAASVSSQWLQAASAAGAGADPPFLRWQPPRVQASCTLPLALVGSAGQGLAGWLTLHRVLQPGAALCLAPVPASALLLRSGTAWDDTLAYLHTLLPEALQPGAPAVLHNTAIAWDVALDHRLHPHTALGQLAGDSAGGLFALGALWLLRDHARPAWRRLLGRLLASDLRQTALTAALGPAFSLHLVGGGLAKSGALAPLADLLARQQPGRPRLVLRFSDAQVLPSMDLPGHVEPRQHADLLSVLAAAADLADPLQEPQRRLLDALCDGGVDAPVRLLPPPPPDGPGAAIGLPAPVDAGLDDLLQAVFDTPATTLRQWLLQGWAAWERVLGGQVQQRHVRLRVQPDALGPGQPRLPEPRDSGDTDLQAVLLLHDSGTHHHAYLLRGAPGAGKTTLLRHHLQRAARRLLLALESADGLPPPGMAMPPDALGHPQPDPRELPVVVALGSLPPEVGDSGNDGADHPALWHWLLQHLAQPGGAQQPAPPELPQLLQGAGNWAALGLRPRLLLDGLNELQVPDGASRAERAAQVLQAVHRGLAGAFAPAPAAQWWRPHPLPMLVSMRQHHGIAGADVVLLAVDVLDWTPDDIGQYLRRRFTDAQAAEHLAMLQATPHALALCGRPMHLAQQCDLWQAGFQVAAADRATLYAAWLWQRLRRMLGKGPERLPVVAPWKAPRVRERSDPRHPAQPQHADHVLLTQADRDALSDDAAWRDAALVRQLPAQGVLLRTLVQQADAQWWNDARAGKALADRSAATVPLADVATGLPPDLRQDFFAACASLGIVDMQRGPRATWKFSHQSWGEYLASTTLLRGRPGDDPQREADLLLRLQPPPLPGADDETHLQALSRSGSDAWRQVPQRLWDEVAPDLPPGAMPPLQLDLREFVDASFTTPAADGDALDTRLAMLREKGYLASFFDDGTLVPDTKLGRIGANLRVWGDTTGVSDALQMHNPAAWRQPDAQGGGWQFLVHSRLPADWRRALLDGWLRPRLLACGLEAGVAAALHAQQGRLALPDAADGAEVLGLALAGLADDEALRAWLGWLQFQGAWPALQGVLPALQARLEPGGPPAPPQAPGMAEPAASATPDVALQALRVQLLAASTGAAQRLQRRLQAGLMLGNLGDTLRYEWATGTSRAGQPCAGWRPRRSQWVAVGVPVGPEVFAIGTGPGEQGHGDERPRWHAGLPGFLACRLPLTVGEWRCFLASPQGQGMDWPLHDNPDFNHPLQPVVGISWYGATAYADWADALYGADWRAAEVAQGWAPLRLALPSEVQWEAAARGPWRATAALVVPGAVPAGHFNHASTRWGRPSPVGVFPASATPLALHDMLGNVWEWCSNVLTPAQGGRGWADAADRAVASDAADGAVPGDRALRGGAFHDTTVHCRPAFRDRYTPDFHNVDIGVRLVRLWLPQSGPRTP